MQLRFFLSRILRITRDFPKFDDCLRQERGEKKREDNDSAAPIKKHLSRMRIFKEKGREEEEDF